jgi:hypothetical protein
MAEYFLMSTSNVKVNVVLEMKCISNFSGIMKHGSSAMIFESVVRIECTGPSHLSFNLWMITEEEQNKLTIMRLRRKTVQR